MSHPDVAISAPGKVLLAGGYLVLDRKYTGLVFGLSARINVIASQIHSGPGVQLNEIVVESPQFLEAQWRYGYRLAPNGGGIKVTQLQVGDEITANPFVETTLNYALTYVNQVTAGSSSHHHALSSSRLIILADDDYYSHSSSSAAAAASSSSSNANKHGRSRFSTFGVTLKDAHKTGLGSSAALVTSLAGAVLTHYLQPRALFDVSSAAGKTTLHNLAQAAHCAAQGKVGSGFDVAAAVHGSCTYRRFSPGILDGVPEAGAPGFAKKLSGVVADGGEAWDAEVVVAAATVAGSSRNEDGGGGGGGSDDAAVRVPKGVALRMCDVDCGSQTVGMVKKVLAWRAREGARSTALWDDLQRRNEALAESLRNHGGGGAGAGGGMSDLPQRVEDVRELIRAMGRLSEVPIEPESQTELLDALARIEGVHGGVVPGAGGFDAVALLMDDDDATEQRVSEFLGRWSEEKGSRVKLLGVKGEVEGVRREELDVYKGWLS